MAEKNNKGSSIATIALFVILAVLAVWAFITPEHLMKTLQSEREFSMRMGGAKADHWIYTQALSGSVGILKDSIATLQTANSLPAQLKNWTQERIIITWLWASLISYRAYMLLLYFIILMPFVMAISMDGWCVREISMHRFSSQSPLKHKMGVLILNGSIAFAVVWLVLPIPIPAVFAPLAILAVGGASWVWLGNLQKRI